MIKLIFKMLGMKKSYVSLADQHLNQAEFVKNSASCSQLKEIKKHHGIFNRVVDKRVKWD